MEKLKYFAHNERVDWMNEPQQINEHIYATDAVIVVRKKGTLKYKAKNQINEKAINLLLETYGENKLSKKIFKTSDIKKQLKEIETVPFYETKIEECDCCDGFGEVDFEFSYNGKDYERSEDCPICDGDGETEVKSNNILGYKISEDAEFKIFDNKHIGVDKIIKILDLSDEIEIYNTDKQFVICKADNYEVVIMGKLIEEGKEKNVFALEPKTLNEVEK